MTKAFSRFKPFSHFLLLLEFFERWLTRRRATYSCTWFYFLRRMLLETLHDYYMPLNSAKSLRAFKG